MPCAVELSREWNSSAPLLGVLALKDGANSFMLKVDITEKKNWKRKDKCAGSGKDLILG